MKAIVCPAAHRIVVEERPMPTRADGEVLLRIRRVGICGTDYHIYEGLHPFLDYPRVIGHELSATVVEAPPDSRFRSGENVVVYPYIACGTCHACTAGKPNCCMRIGVLGVHRDGGMCEFISLPQANLIPADGLSLEAAATVEFLAIGAHAVRRAGPMTGLKTLVVGAGPIGLGAAIFAAIAGADVTLLDRDAGRLALARAATRIDQTVTGEEAAAGALRAATDGNGFDRVFDATGNRASMEASFAQVAHGGTCVFVGLIDADITFSDAEFHKREMVLMASRNALLVDFEQVISSIRSGSTSVSSIVTHETSLAKVATDLPRWARDKDGLIKALVIVD